MMVFIRRLAVVALIGGGLGGQALAAPFGGAALLEAHTRVDAIQGFLVSKPDLIAGGTGVRVHGSVCRTNLSPSPAPRSMRLEHLDAGGRIVSAVDAGLSGNLSARTGLTCAYYDLQPGWTVAAADTVRVCAAGRRRDSGCTD